jgi:hypothetical protein
MIRNYVWTGNPVYPLGDGLLGARAAAVAENAADAAERGADRPAAENSNSGLNHFALRTVGFGESPFEILTIPVRIFFQGADDDPQYFDGRLNPYLLFFPIAALALVRRSRRSAAVVLEQRLMAGFSVVYLLLSFLLTDMRVRYVAPILPPLVILAVFGLADMKALVNRCGSLRIRRFSAVGLFSALAFLLVLNGVYIQELMGRVQPFGYLIGGVSRDAYIQKHRPEYAAHTYINRHLAGDSRVLCLFTGNRIYYSDREMVCDPELFRGIIRSAASVEAVQDRLRQHGISHLLLHGPIFHRWANVQFDDRGQDLLQRLFQQNLKSLFQGHDYYLFQIPPGPGRAVEKSAL